MVTHSAAGSARAKEASTWIGGVVVIGIVVVGFWLTIDAVVNGPHVWEDMDRQNAAAIEQEDRAFCGRLNMEPGTEAFESCARELAQIRYLQTERMRRYRF